MQIHLISITRPLWHWSNRVPEAPIRTHRKRVSWGKERERERGRASNADRIWGMAGPLCPEDLRFPSRQAHFSSRSVSPYSTCSSSTTTEYSMLGRQRFGINEPSPKLSSHSPGDIKHLQNSWGYHLESRGPSLHIGKGDIFPFEKNSNFDNFSGKIASFFLRK